MAPKATRVCSLLQRCTSVLLMGTLFFWLVFFWGGGLVELLSNQQTARSSFTRDYQTPPCPAKPPPTLSSHPAVTERPPASAIPTTVEKLMKSYACG